MTSYLYKNVEIGETLSFSTPFFCLLAHCNLIGLFVEFCPNPCHGHLFSSGYLSHTNCILDHQNFSAGFLTVCPKWRNLQKAIATGYQDLQPQKMDELEADIRLCSTQQTYYKEMAFHLKGLELLVEEQPKLAATLLFVMILVSVVALVLTSVFYVTRKVIERRLMKQMRRTHEAELRSRSKSIALDNASDDIRQVLDGWIDLLPRGSEKSSLMQGCANDVKEVLDGIQIICKIEAGVLESEFEEFNLAHMLEEVADDCQEDMIEKEERVEVVLDPCDGSVSMFGNVRGDSFKLELIIHSLMSNAVKYTPRGSISIRAWAKRHQRTTSIFIDTNSRFWLNWFSRIFFFFKDEEDYNKAGMDEDFSAHRRPNCMEYIFEVDDTGTGIPIDEQKSVFENFILVDDPGFRLGLDAIRSLVRSMGGDIGIVDKEEPGTCFKFNIYLEAAAPTDENLQMADIEVDGSTSLVVLLIQNQERRRVVKRYFERLRIKVLIVKHWEYLQGHLSRLKTKIMPLSQNSNISSDWIVNDYYISRRKCEEPTTTFIMFLIDVSLGPPKELAAMVEEFRSDVSNVVISKVVWLNGGDGHGRVDDVFLSKDLHGSRLQQVVKMLPEFGGGLCHTGSSKTSQKPNVGVRQRITSKKVSHD